MIGNVPECPVAPVSKVERDSRIFLALDEVGVAVVVPFTVFLVSGATVAAHNFRWIQLSSLYLRWKAIKIKNP